MRLSTSATRTHLSAPSSTVRKIQLEDRKRPDRGYLQLSSARSTPGSSSGAYSTSVGQTQSVRPAGAGDIRLQSRGGGDRPDSSEFCSGTRRGACAYGEPSAYSVPCGLDRASAARRNEAAKSAAGCSTVPHSSSMGASVLLFLAALMIQLASAKEDGAAPGKPTVCLPNL